MTMTRVAVLVGAASLAFAQSTAPPVLISGLQRPMRLAVTPRGNLLVSETSLAPNEGRISIVTTTGGDRRTLLVGLPSGTDVTGGSSGPTAMALRGERTLYIAMGAGDLERRGTRPGSSVVNPEGASSPLFCSVLQVNLNEPIDMVRTGFQLSSQNRQRLADGYSVELRNESGDRAQVDVLTQFRCAVPDPNTIYRFSNPFGLAVRRGDVLVADASQNTLLRVDAQTGRSQVMTRFAPIRNSTAVGPPMLDAVPDSVHLYGDDLLVTLLTGFPFTPGNSRVMLVNGRTGEASQFINFNNSAVDLVYRPRPSGPAEFYVLEFSTDQGANPAPPGRILRYTSPTPTVLQGGLIAPSSLAYVPGTNDLYVLSLTGTISKVTLP